MRSAANAPHVFIKELCDNMKRLFAAFLFAVAFSCSACAARAESIDGVWGIDFGVSPEKAHALLVEKNAKVVCEYGYAPDYSESVYQVDFFGRKGSLLLRFSGKGLYLARFAFIRDERLKSETQPEPKPDEKGDKIVDARSAFDAPKPSDRAKAGGTFEYSRNFRQLKNMLDGKYGLSDYEFKDGETMRGCRWTDGRKSVTLYESRSITKNDTALTYEDASRR